VEAVVYLNGSLIPQSQARISPLDYGFLYGYGLFETMRAYSGHVFRLEKHLARLERSARALNIDLYSATKLEAAVYNTLRANHLSDARIRLTVSPGEEEPSPNVPAKGEPTVFITARSYDPPSEQIYLRGLTATVSTVRRSPRSPGSGLKSLSALDILVARQRAAFDGVDHAILLNDDGLVAEGGSSNVFCVKGGTLYTPAERCGVLPGITRDVVLRELAPSLAIAAEEVDMALADLVEADEAFLTNSMFEIMPLTNVADWVIGSGHPGALTLRLMKAYKALVERSPSQQGRTGTT
jgi:branched-subunit amino acid aminotransferase/4-amino-4-deoxychorismate lyase